MPRACGTKVRGMQGYKKLFSCMERGVPSGVFYRQRSLVRHGNRVRRTIIVWDADSVGVSVTRGRVVTSKRIAP